MPHVNSNGIQLYYEDTDPENAKGLKPLVLISGLGYGLWVWHKMVPHLAEHFRVIRFDNRGAGQTDKPEGAYTAQMLAADAVGLLDALEIEKAIIFGHSMGGFIAQAIAIDYPQRVEQLILSATNFGGPNHAPITPEALAVLTNREGDPVDLVKRGVTVACSPGFAEKNPEVLQELVDYRLSNPVPPAAYQSQFAIGVALMPEEAAFEQHLPKVTAPTLILFGQHDKVVPPMNAELLAKQLPNASIAILPDAGHLYPMEAPEVAAKTVIDALKSEDT